MNQARNTILNNIRTSYGRGKASVGWVGASLQATHLLLNRASQVGWATSFCCPPD